MGDVYPCELLTKQYPLGNLKKFDYNINNILKNTTSKNAKQFIKDTKCKCSFECALSSNVAWMIFLFWLLIRKNKAIFSEYVFLNKTEKLKYIHRWYIVLNF